MEATNHRHIAMLLFIFFMLAFRSIDALASSQKQSDESYQFSSLLDSAEIMKLKGFYDESIELINQVKQQSLNQADWVNYTRSFLELTDVLRFSYYYSKDSKTIQEAYSLLDHAYQTVLKHLDSTHIIMSRYYIYKGKLIKDEGKCNSDTLLYYLQKANSILENNNEGPKELAKVKYEFGTYYNNASQTVLAEDYFNQLVSAVIKFDELDYFRAYYLYRANQFYYDIADFEKSLLCANIALFIFNHPKHKDISNALSCENDIAAVYISSDILSSSTYQKALSQFNKIYNAIKPDSHDALSFIILYNMGVALKELHQYDSAIRTFNKSIEINPSNSFDDSILLVSSKLYLDLVDFIQKGDSMNGLKLEKSMKSIAEIRGVKHYRTHVFYRTIGEEYEKKGNYNQALNYYQNGLVSLYNDFNSLNIYDNPNWENTENVEPVLYILLAKARTLFTRYMNSGNEKDLETAFNIFQDGYELMSHLLTSEMMNESFIILFQNFKTDFQVSVECALEAYDHFSDIKYLNSAFHFIEQSKYFLLLKSQQNAMLMNRSGVEKEVFLKERSINSEIEQLKHHLNIEDNLDPEEAFIIRNTLLDKIIDKTNIINKINGAIDGSETQIDLQTLSLDQVQKEILKKDEIIIEYYWSKEVIYALILETNTVNIVKIPINKELLGRINIYTQALSKKQLSKDFFIKYTTSSNYLYKTLFKPVIEKSSWKDDKTSITIISDGGLAFLPFEAFTTVVSDTTHINYWGLPYLCKDYSINYAYSLNILHKNLSSFLRKRNNKILAMSYSPVFSEQTDIESLRNKNELPYSGLEINDISRTFHNAEYDVYEEATEGQFKALAQDYAIIHLAIHGSADTINRYNSKLLFKSDSSENEDGQLHDYELYTLDLSYNQLAVLSACETGLGKQLEGEGIISIARGFAYAGSPAIVMSLWKVNDKSTSMLMKYFYENLSKGMHKDKALQLAKISYIGNSDELSAHPANWAAFIAMGNNKPIRMSSKIPWTYYLIISLAGLLIILAIIKYKRQH